MDRPPRVCIVYTFHDQDDTGTARTYALDGVSLAEIEQLLGQPLVVEIITPAQIEAAEAIPKGPHLFLGD